MDREPAGNDGDALIGATSIFATRFERARLTDLGLWYLISAALVYVAPSTLRLGAPPWGLPPAEEIQALYWLVSFLLSTFLVILSRALGRRQTLPVLAIMVTLPWALVYLALSQHAGIPYSRVVAAASGALGAVLIAVPAMLPGILRGATAALTLAGALVAGATVVTAHEDAVAPTVTTRVVDSGLLPLSISFQGGLLPDTDAPGGAMARLGDGFLTVTADGAWYMVRWDSTGALLRSRALHWPAPTARERLVLDSPWVEKPMLRVTGLAIDASAGERTVFVAHEVWDPIERCIAMQVSSMAVGDLARDDPSRSWRKVYVTAPCLKPRDNFDPYEGGGRLALKPDGSLLLTTGDYGLNRVAGSALSQLEGDYGKTLVIGRDGTRTLNTRGHRNPQGVTIDLAGNAWITEHGPRGGDEVNRLVPGANYGWPIVTYGTDYGGYRWRAADPTRTQAPYHEPALALVPSIGISPIMTVHDSLFPGWTGDLLAGSLGGGQLLRMRVSDDRIVYTERIRIGRRIRDIAEGSDGRILLWTDDSTIGWLAPAAALADGALAFESCIRCHGDDAEGTHRGPGLVNLFDRPVAAGDFEYSAALQDLGGRWTDERIDAYLEDPDAFVPGTAMAFEGIADSTTRQALTAYLRRITDAR